MTIFPKQEVKPTPNLDLYLELLLAAGIDETDWHGNILRKGANPTEQEVEEILQAMKNIHDREATLRFLEEFRSRKTKSSEA
jgi:hypothetical protein